MRAGGDVSIALYQGPSYPRADYTRDVSALLAFHRERFVGRDRELAFVAECARRPDPGYLLVAAPGGFGKSTLLAQVVDRISAGQWPGPAPALACYFVRADGARNTSAAFLAAVNAQFLGLLGLPGGTPPGIAELQTQFSELWSAAAQRATEARPVLLVVDGLDEMADEDVSVADVLPAGLGPYVHVVVSSREVPDVRERVDRAHPLRTATAMSLPAFGLEGIRLMLDRYVADVADVADGVAERILGITGGEPLFARFVCEELGQRGVGELDRLEAHPPVDAEDYFREQLRRLDEAELGEVSWQILGTLVVAHGGMTAAELAEVLDRPARVVRPALRPVERFLLGDKRLDIFHRALRELVAGEFSASELATLQRGILEWCAGYGARGWPEETPAYVLDHYAAHLAEDHEASLVALPDLVWMTRRRHASGSLGGFIGDAELALDTAAASADQVRLCLVLASARSVATSAPAAAVGVLARLGYVTEARSYVELIQGEERRAGAFRELGAALHATGDAAGAHEAFVAAVEQLSAEEYKLGDFVPALEAVAAALGDAADVEALTALLAVAESVEYDRDGATCVAATATALARAGTAEPARRAVKGAATALLARAAAGTGRPEGDEDEEEGIEIGAVGALAAAAGGLGLRELLEALGTAAAGPEDLAGVAEGWARAGEERRALDVTARIAGDVADAVPVLKADCFAAVRRELAREALASLPPSDEWGYGFALEAAAKAAGAAGDPEGLAAAAAAVTAEMFDDSSLVSVAVGWAALGRGPQAVEVLRRMPVGDGSYLDSAGPEIATALARAGLFDDALAAAAVAVDPAARAAGIAAVARGRLDAGDEAGALADARRAVSEGETLAETGEAAALAVLARAFTRAGDAARAAEATERARVALEQILPGARSDGDARPVFEALLDAGRLDAARAVADGEYPNARLLAQLARAHAQTGDREVALELSARVAEMARTNAFGTESVDLLFAVAATHAALGDPATASDCIRLALTLDDVGMEVDLELRKIAGLVAAGRADEAAERARRVAGDPDTEPGPAAFALAEAELADEAAPIARAAIAAWAPTPDLDGGRSHLLALAGLLPPDEAAEAIRAVRPGAAAVREPYWRAGHLAALAAALHPLDPAEARAAALDALRAARLGGRRAFLMSVVVPAVDVVAECASLSDLYAWILEVGSWWAPD